MEHSAELMKFDENHSLVAVFIGEKLSQFVVCSHYDATQPFGTQWCWGHYFGTDLMAAIEYGKENYISQ